MAPRLLWFALGGATAAWWIKKHDDYHHGEGPKDGRPQCMQHSWGWRSRHWDEYHPRPLTPEASTLPSRTEDGVRANVAADGTDPSERLSTAVRTGIRNILDTMLTIENVSKEERAAMERRRQELSSSSATPSFPAATGPTEPAPPSPSTKERAPFVAEKTTPPIYVSQPQTVTADQTMSQVLAALEKINQKLDGPNPKSQDDNQPPRLV